MASNLATRITFALAPELAAWLKARSERHGLSVGWIVRQALMQYRERVERQRESIDDRRVPRY